MELSSHETKNKSSESYLILWNNGNYDKILSQVFGKQRVVTSAADLAALNLEQFSFSGAVVLVELLWDNHAYSQLYGIEIVKAVLRAQKKVKFPILFVSFLSFEHILLNKSGNKRLENQIVGAVGHDFLRLPLTSQNLLSRLEELPPLNELQFADVFNNLCNLKGLIRGRIHELQGQLCSLENAAVGPKKLAEEIFEKALDEITILLKDNSRASGRIRQFKEEFRTSSLYPDHSPKYIQEFLDRRGSELAALVEEDRNNGEKIQTVASRSENQPWKVLLLDDEPSSLLALQNTLENRGIEFVLAQTVDKAKKIITGDIYNEITVAISDYRLLEKTAGVERHQRQQGYDFLFWLATEDHLAHLIALSGLSRKFLLESFQKYNARIDVYSKQDLSGEHAVSLFVDNIQDRGHEVHEAVCSRPIVGDWKSLKPFYAAHRASTEYRLKEQEINARASRYIRQYEELLEHHDETYLLKPDLDRISELTTKLAGKKSNDSRGMEALYSKLVGRRIALWLHLKLGFSRNEVFAALKGQLSPATILLEIESELKDANQTYDEKLAEELKVKVHKKYKDNSTNLITTNLAISFPVASNELLIEERYWLQKEIGVRSFDSPFSLSRQIPYFVQIGIEQFLEVAQQVAAKLRERNKNFTRSGKLVLVGFEEANDIIKNVHQLISSESEKKHFQDLLKVLNQNIKANVGDNPLSQEFLSLVGELSD